MGTINSVRQSLLLLQYLIKHVGASRSVPLSPFGDVNTFSASSGRLLLLQRQLLPVLNIHQLYFLLPWHRLSTWLSTMTNLQNYEKTKDWSSISDIKWSIKYSYHEEIKLFII